MRTVLQSLGIGVLPAILSMTGCGTSADLDVSQLPIADEEAKQDQVEGVSEFLWVRPSAAEIFCIRAPCSNHEIADVNRNNVRLVYAYDWRALKLSATDQSNLEANAGKVLFYGRYVSTRALGEPVQVFQATRANPRVSDRSVDNPGYDRYYTVRAGDPSCQQPPCATWSARQMNQKDLPGEQWSGIDLSRLELSQADEQRLVTDLQNGKAFLSVSDPAKKPVAVSEAFRPLK